MRLLFIVLGISIGLGRISPSEAGLTERCLYKIDSTVQSAMADTVFPGAVIAVVRKDKLAFMKSYGAQAVYPEYEPATDSTIYDIASLSKPVSTAIAALQLAEQGRLNLLAPVSDYLEGFADYDITVGRDEKRRRIQKKITVKDLLYHTSGLPSYAWMDKIRKDYDGDLIYYIVHKAKRGFKPGSRERYSCLNYIALQKIIEKISGEPLCDYAEANIFKPLGMKDTRYYPGGVKDSVLLKRIAPTEMLDSVNVRRGFVHDPLAWEYGNGNSGNAGVFSTAGDLAVLCAALMNSGNLCVDGEKRSILKEKTVELLYKVDEISGRTAGWDNCSSSSKFAGDTFDRSRLLCHTGFTGPSIVIDDVSKTAIIIMCNRVHPEDRGSLNYNHTNLKDVRTAISEAVARSVILGE